MLTGEHICHSNIHLKYFCSSAHIEQLKGKTFKARKMIISACEKWIGKWDFSVETFVGC